MHARELQQRTGSWLDQQPLQKSKQQAREADEERNRSANASVASEAAGQIEPYLNENSAPSAKPRSMAIEHRSATLLSFEGNGRERRRGNGDGKARGKKD